MVISMTQYLYMCFDAIFIFLESKCALLDSLAIVTTIVCFVVTYLPGENKGVTKRRRS